MVVNHISRNDERCDALPVIADRASFNQGENALYDPFIGHTDTCPTIIAKGPHAVQPPIAFKVRCGGEYTGTKGGEVRSNERGGTGMLHYEDKTFTVAATQDQFVATPVAYSIREDSSANTFHAKETDTALCVTSLRPSPMAQHAQNFVVQPQQVIPINTMAALRPQSADENRQTFGVGSPGDNMYTITAHHHHAIGVQPQQLLYENHPQDSRVTGPHNIAPTVAAKFGTGGGNVPLVQGADPVTWQPGNLRLDAGADPSTVATTTLKASMGDQMPHIATPMAVRRLLPSECEALQGFPKDWTKISWRGKSPDECPDGPRYKAIGNSMAVNCMHWIGRRIQLVEDIISETK
jgi:site-specific DNA-cytosine methylase